MPNFRLPFTLKPPVPRLVSHTVHEMLKTLYCYGSRQFKSRHRGTVAFLLSNGGSRVGAAKYLRHYYVSHWLSSCAYDDDVHPDSLPVVEDPRFAASRPKDFN